MIISVCPSYSFLSCPKSTAQTEVLSSLRCELGYSLISNCRGVNYRIFDFFHGFQFISTPLIKDFRKNISEVSKVCYNIVKFRLFPELFPPPPIYYTPPNLDVWQKTA